MRWANWARSRELDEFDWLIESRDIAVLFQPIVDLRTDDVVAYEALARPPAGSSYPDVTALFREAYRRGRVGELDWACRNAVFAAALAKKVPAELPLFFNVEPLALGAPLPVDIVGRSVAATQQRRFVVEVTERSIADDPAELMAAVARARDGSIGVALDDVGAEPASLALMSLVAPDVIKLDLSIIQAQPSTAIARIVNTVLSEAERTGAIILAEGIESPDHVRTAQSMGAALGQGWYFGPPGPLPDSLEPPRDPLPLRSTHDVTAETPFAAIRRRRTPVASTKQLLEATSRYLENEILHSSGKSVLLASFQTAMNFGPMMQRRYERLARHTVLTAVFGRDIRPAPGLGIRGANLHPDDPMCQEWTVVVLGSQFAAALVARRTDNTVDGFEAATTHDRDLVVAVARSLLQRLPPADHPW